MISTSNLFNSVLLSSFFLFFFKESEIKQLEKEIELLKNSNKILETENVTPELEKLRTENSKLKYQMIHLKKVCVLWQITSNQVLKGIQLNDNIEKLKLKM